MRPGFAPAYAPLEPEPLPQGDNGNSRIFAFVDDLFFQAKIQETARKLNVKVEFVKTEKDLLDHMKLNGEEKPSLIIFDMNNANAKPLTLIPKLKTKLKKGTSIIGFLSHVQGDLKMKAHEVGCDMVLPRSAFSQNLPQLLRRHGAPEAETPMGRPKAALVLSPEQRAQLENMASSRSLPAGLVTRVRIVLLSAAGKMNQQIARQLGLTNATVGKWRRRFVEQGVAGLHDELRPGRPRPISDELIALDGKTLETKPKGGTHWSVRQIAGQTRLSKSTVHRIWRAFGLEPHRQRHFKLSTDPFFVEKVRDIVGLYLHPPENAVVLCVDEKSQIQALERTQPMLPIALGYVEGVTHDYRRRPVARLAYRWCPSIRAKAVSRQTYPGGVLNTVFAREG